MGAQNSSRSGGSVSMTVFAISLAALFVFSVGVSGLFFYLNTLKLQNDYISVLEERNDLTSQYLALQGNYSRLQNQYTQLQADYTQLMALYQQLLGGLENITYSSAYASVDSFPNGTSYWQITMSVKNTGSADASIDNILINSHPIDQQTAWTGTWTAPGPAALQTLPISVPASQSATINLVIRSGYPGCSSGTNIEIDLHSAIGETYPQMINLP